MSNCSNIDWNKTYYLILPRSIEGTTDVNADISLNMTIFLLNSESDRIIVQENGDIYNSFEVDIDDGVIDNKKMTKSIDENGNLFFESKINCLGLGDHTLTVYETVDDERLYRGEYGFTIQPSNKMDYTFSSVTTPSYVLGNKNFDIELTSKDKCGYNNSDVLDKSSLLFKMKSTRSNFPLKFIGPGVQPKEGTKSTYRMNSEGINEDFYITVHKTAYDEDSISSSSIIKINVCEKK